jgi:hypothetical protein
MTQAATAGMVPSDALARRALTASARFWFAAVVVGQALFAFYILAFYGVSTLSGDFAAWAKNENLIRGYAPGDTAGNLAFASHVLMAAVITVGGTLQLVPQIRARAPAAHRWTGRAFFACCMLTSLGGLFLVWGRDVAESAANALAISLDAILILAFCGLAWRAARSREIARHRRWALRAFLVANGVWFLRIGIVAYGILRQAAGGAGPSMATAFDVWNFGAYLVPLAILELYFLAQAKGGAGGRLAMAAGLTLATLAMSLGIVGAWFGMFAPVLAKL